MDDHSIEDAPESLDEPALKRIRAVATFLDESVEIPGVGYKIGADPILGALPVAGDLVSAGMSMYIVAEAANLGVPLNKLLRMIANVTVDTVVGAVPVLGTLFDAIWKANVKNVEMVEDHLESMAGDDDEFESDPVKIEIDEE
ncbi:hypothetical protein AUR64_12040 [Haloprofundus marisrubri]|uniref:DUF4112 domain-containing protein n=1 Tax=Haloprofundus marisrubri TaxID=1514971 RepID=A0A0W1RA29_9EURY|nr:DUF4112 domain-containing protein [Haloprofundus marisrubri]KTG10300.1 hypothetical protein AUR64_12040 [Haloprofundus marisrubri]